MKLSLFYFTFFLFVLLSTADPTEFNTNSCPTSRHLLFFGSFNFPIGEKKSQHISSSSKSSSKSSSPSSSPPSSPPKYARADGTHGLTVFIRPQTSSELGHKVRSYSHLLKSKLFTKEERAKLKKLKIAKKKPNKKKNVTEQATKTRDLVAINDQERDRCRALLQIDHQKNIIPTKDIKKTKKEKNSISTKVKNVTTQAKKKVAAVATKALPIKEKPKSQKVKPTKSDTPAASNEKVKPTKSSNTKSAPKEKAKPTKSNTKSPADEKKKPSETKPLTPPPIKEVPIKKPSPPPPPPPSPSPPVQPSINTKPKREKPPPPPPVIEEPSEVDELIDMDNDEKNNSVVGRAYHFVKNMFQLSDDMLEDNQTYEEDQIISSTNEQHRPSRKLLSIDDETNDFQLDDIFPDLALSVVSISKRQLLSVKTNKRSISTKTTNTKEKKKTNFDGNKPKVGWNYRYRISRYLADQKMKRTGHGKKITAGGGRSKQPQLQSNKKSSSSSNTKVSKRKLLELNCDDQSSCDSEEISNQDIVNTVTITQEFVPKRQLLATKKTDKDEKDTDEEDDIDKINARRRIKSYEELTDPIEIVRSYDRGLFKPRVGWQFRYRVSRYIDSLRNNIREDQERLKLGLQAIKRKTPQELSGRRKRVLDKPFAPEAEKPTVIVDENKPNVGWRYRYRVSKMLEAKQRGEYVDDEELKRKARTEQKRKPLPPGSAKPVGDDDECIEWEYDLDPELRKIGEEGKRVGWAYRYRVRRKLDELKQKQAETGIPFDWETLGGKREKKVAPTATSSKAASDEKPLEANKKAVGWKYRYRVSKMREAQKYETVDESTKSTSKKHEQVPSYEGFDPVLARLTPEERVVGWKYRYRIRRKLDAIKNVTRETEGGKRGRKQKEVSKRKENEKMIKKVEESIEKILNIDDIDETPFMEYFRRSSSYVLFGLVPTVRKSVCLLPLPVIFSFCKEDENEDAKETLTITELPKQISTKKLQTKKEKRAKQFIQSRPTRLDSTDEKIDDAIKSVSKTPTTTMGKLQSQKRPSRPRSRSSVRRNNDEQIKHFDEEEQPVKKLIGVDSKKKKNKKQFQIIGQEVKIKSKHSAALPIANPPPIATTIPSTPVTTTNPPPPVTASPPVAEIPKTTPRPSSPPAPSPKPEIVPTTTPAPLRSISEIIQEEATTLLSTKTSFSEEAKEEVSEANENTQATTTTITASSVDLNDSTTSGEEDNDSTSDDSESSASGTDNDSDEETEETEDD